MTSAAHASSPDPMHPGVPLVELSAEAIAQRAQRGGPGASLLFEELVRRYEARLYNFLARRAGREAAEDLTQETFVRAWERLDSYNAAWRFSTWLFTIGSRLAITRHRRSRPTSGPAALDTAPTPARDNAREMELGARLWTLAGAHLSDDQQTALWLRYVEDMAIADIARVMEKSDVGVRVCLFRARHALAELSGLDRTLEHTARGPLVPSAASSPPEASSPEGGTIGSLAGGLS